jgi:hypothetical protein
VTKPSKTTDALDAINVANEAIDSQAGGAGEQARKTRAELDSTMAKTDAAIKNTASKGSGTP